MCAQVPYLPKKLYPFGRATLQSLQLERKPLALGSVKQTATRSKLNAEVGVLLNRDVVEKGV